MTRRRVKTETQIANDAKLEGIMVNAATILDQAERIAELEAGLREALGRAEKAEQKRDELRETLDECCEVCEEKCPHRQSNGDEP